MKSLLLNQKRNVLIDFNSSQAAKGLNISNKKINSLDAKSQNQAINSSLKIYHTALLSSIYES